MKKLTKVLLLLTLVISLSGCMKVKVEMDVKSSTDMTMKLDYLIEEKLLTASGMTEEEFIEEMKTSMGDSVKAAKITPKSENIDGTKWIGMTLTGPIEDEQLKDFLSEKEIDGKKSLVLTLSKDFMSSNQFGGVDADKITEQTGYSIDKLKTLGMEMSIVINMPANAKSNFGEVDGKKVTIDLLDLNSKGNAVQKIEISSALSGGFDMTNILIVVGVIAILGVVFVMMKKKKKPEFIEITNTEEVIQPHDTTTETTPEEQIIAEVVEETPEADEHPIQEVISKTEMNPTETYCPNCGGRIGTDDAFCQKCGFNLKK